MYDPNDLSQYHRHHQGDEEYKGKEGKVSANLKNLGQVIVVSDWPSLTVNWLDRLNDGDKSL